jgi:hypothetical protein
MRNRSEETLSSIIGKIVSGIVLSTNVQGHPRSQIFLTFHDGTAFEIWGDNEVLYTGSGLDHQTLDDIVRIQKRRQGVSIVAFRPPHEDLSNPQLDLLAGF